MNTNIQVLIKSFSPEKRKEIQQYVLDNMDAEIRNATIHGSVTPKMENELEKIIIKYLQDHYPDDINYTLKLSQNEVEEKIQNLVENQLNLMASTPVEEQTSKTESAEVVNTPVHVPGTHNDENFIFSMNTKPRQFAQVIPPEQNMETLVEKSMAQGRDQHTIQANPSNSLQEQEIDQEVDQNEHNLLLGENTGYHQHHDHDNRFFGLQRRVYKLLSYTDDETAESYFRIVVIVGSIMVFLGAWNLFNDFSTISSMQNYYSEKTPIWMRQLAAFCQSNMSIFQQCVADRQASLIKARRIEAFNNFLIITCGGCIVFIAYFLKLNYRGRDSYREQEDS